MTWRRAAAGKAATTAATAAAAHLLLLVAQLPAARAFGVGRGSGASWAGGRPPLTKAAAGGGASSRGRGNGGPMAASAASSPAGSGPHTPVRDILALDFDGVICNSVGESSTAAYRSVRKLWPQLATFCSPLSSASTAPGAVPETPRWLADSLRQLRPLVETGYENVLLARLIMEQYLQASGSAPKLSVKELESKWPGSLRSALLHRYGVTAQDLVDLFGSVRDEWLVDDPDGWIEANEFYAGADLSLGCGNLEAYVITTKQTRFVEALLQARGIALPRERIFGLGSGPKTDVLARLVRLARKRASSDENMDREPVLHFVEDRVETLEKICADLRLQNVQLYFADWGYSTQQQRERALLNPRIRVLDQADFACMCRALDPYRTTFECCRASCQDGCFFPERFSFQAPKVEGAEQGGKSKRVPRTMAVCFGNEEAGLEEAEEERKFEGELLELMALREEGHSSSSSSGGG